MRQDRPQRLQCMGILEISHIFWFLWQLLKVGEYFKNGETPIGLECPVCSEQERNWKGNVGRERDEEERQGVDEEYLHPGISQMLCLVMHCSVIMWEVIKRVKSAELQGGYLGEGRD